MISALYACCASAEKVAITQRPFSDVMEEAKQFWISYLESSETEDEKDYRLGTLNGIIVKVFGKPLKLSTVLPSQQDLLELVVDEFKNL